MNGSAQPVQETVAKERLLAAALALFTTKGYAASSVREIVQAAGVTKPVLYYHFGNKEGIYLEILRGVHAQFETLLEDCLQRNGTVEARLLALCDGIFQLFMRQINVARLMYAIYYGPPQGAPFFDLEAYHLKLHELVGDLVREGIRTGELRREIPEDIGWVVMGALNVVLEEQLCQREPRIGREGLARIVALIVKGIGKGALR